MGKQRFSGYEPLAETPVASGLDQNYLDQQRLRVERSQQEKAARERRQAELNEFLKDYDDDPVARTLGTMEFNKLEQQRQSKAQAETRQKQRQQVAEEHDQDPLMQTWALGMQDIEARKNLPQKQAFADAEALEKIKERDRTSRKLDRMGLGNAFLRESIGSAVNVVPDLAAVPARAMEAVGIAEPGTTNELNRQSVDFQQARQISREDDMSPWLSRMYGGTSQSLLQMAATPGGATSKIVGAGVMSGNQALTTAEDAGLSGPAGLRYAATQAGLESLIALAGQKLFGAGIESRLAGQTAAAETWKQLAKNGVLDGLKEAPEEVLTTVLQDISSKLEGVSPDMTMDDFVTNAAESAVQSFMMAWMAAAPNAARLAIRGSDRTPPDSATPAAGTVPPSTPTADPATQAAEPVQGDIVATPDSPQLQKAKAEFVKKPSAINYEALLKAGFSNPIPNTNRDGRSRLQAELAREATMSPSASPPVSAPLDDETPVKLSSVGRAMDLAAKYGAMDPNGPTAKKQDADLKANLEWHRKRIEAEKAASLETPPGTVPGGQPVPNGGSYENVIPENQQIQQPQGQPQQGPEEGQGGRQEGLLTTPTNSRIPPADHTRESFEKEYIENYIEMNVIPPDSPEYQALESRMADLYDAHPDWAQNLETTQPPPSVVGQTEAGPDQSSPPATGSVSSEPAENQTSPVSESTPSDSDRKPLEGEKGWRRQPGEPRNLYHDRLKHRGWKKSPKPDISVIDSPDRVLDLSRQQLKTDPLKAGDAVTLHTGFAGEDMQTAAEVVEDTGPSQTSVKVRTSKGDLYEANAYYVTRTPSNSNQLPATPTDSPVPAFAALPQKSQDLFNKAFDSKDVEQLKQMVDKSNVAWNKEFERRTGVKLPRTLKDRYRAVMEWANPTPTYGKRSEIPKWGIYQTMSQGKPKFSVKESDNDKGFGDSLHDTAEEAKKYADIGRQRETERAEAAAKRQAAEEADQKKQQDHEASFQGFLTDDPMVKGRRLKTLDTLVNYEKKPISRKALVEKRVADGWAVNDEDQLQAPTGEFLDVGALTKTGIDYARHLIDLKPAKAETPPADSQPELNEVEQATLDELMGLLAPNQTPVKPEKKPRSPKAAAGSQAAAVKKPRSKAGEKIAKAKAESDAEVKALYATFVEDMKSLKITRMAFPGAPPVMDPKAIASAVRLTAGLAKNGILTFADFATLTIENIGAELATKLAPYLETAWTMLKRVPGYTGIDDAGSISEFINQRNEAKNASTNPQDGGMEAGTGVSGGSTSGETGTESKDVDTEAASGPDGESVPENADGTAEAESGDTRSDAQGDGTGTGVRTKSKRKPKRNKSGGTATAEGLQNNVAQPGNLRIGPDDVIAPAGAITKMRANVAAIKLLRQLQSENRPATPEEQKVLMQYTGWGSLPQVFDKIRGEAFRERPGLKDMYNEWYPKAQIYRRKRDSYVGLEELRKRVEAWEDQFGQAYSDLKEILTPEEWDSAKASTLNAHFTSRDVITHGIWDALERMGVSGGRFIEPSAGIGSLIGLMPESLATNTEVMAVELDSITGEMVKRLYPDAKVFVQGLETVPIPPASIDFAATNVPFNEIGPNDAETRYGRPMNLHNYFIARILDSLRPGGIAAVISTHFTMDANPKDRALLAGKAELIGAVRLPNDAFKSNAGTEVVTDLMFFRKPDGNTFVGEQWSNLVSVGEEKVVDFDKKGNPVETMKSIVVNEYFANHPEMVLGTHSLEGTMRSSGEYTVQPIEGAKLAEQLKKAIQNLPVGLANSDNATGDIVVSPDSATATEVEGRIELHKGKLQEYRGGQWSEPQWLKHPILFTKKGDPRKLKEDTKKKKIEAAITQGIAYTAVRNAYEQHIANMLDANVPEEDYLKSQTALNKAYDAYRSTHGPLNADNSSWLEPDPEFFRAAGLEVVVESMTADGKAEKAYAKSDVFRTRTVDYVTAPTTADSIEDAVKLSLAWKGILNVPWMAELTNSTEEEVRQQLLDSGVVFADPTTGMLEPMDTYLSGNVHAKLRQAEQAVKDGDASFQKNVDALKSVQPAKMTIDVITPSLGVNWITPDIISEWTEKDIGHKLRIRYNEKADLWSVYGGEEVSQETQGKWGTLRVGIDELLNDTLNGRITRVYIPRARGDKSAPEIDEAQTQAATFKQEKMRTAFEAWAKKTDSVIPKIEQAFNEQKNFYVKPKWNGEHQTFPGMDAVWLKQIRPYQKNSIWRAIREGRGMIAHGVGAGKTLEIIATAMELKRLGLSKKPLIVVQNSTLGQFARTFMQVYPAGKVLVATSDDLSPDNRKKFMARITSGDWDSIVMAKSTFNAKLPNDPRREKAMVDGIIAELEQVLADAEMADGKGAPSVKQIQQQINALKKRLDGIIERVNSHTDDNVYFEQMGIDSLFLDEAHDYKKPPFVTKLDRSIKGISKEVSGRALSALIKLRYVQEKNKGRNTFMATGTPVTNTLGEAWLLMNMIAPDVLTQFGVETFDQFVASFARISTTLEPNAVNKMVRRTRLAKFKNGHSLGQFIQAGWDVLLGKALHDEIRQYSKGGNIPKIRGGKETLHLVERSKEFEKFGEFFLKVYDEYKKLTGEDKKLYSWVPVVIYGAAQAAAIDVRLVNPTAKDDPGSKVNQMVDGVYEAYVKGTNVTLQSGDTTLTGQNLTQLIFSDISGRRSTAMLDQFAAGVGVTIEADDEVESGDDDAPAVNIDEDRWLYQEIKRKLIAKGIPENQVQLINDHNKNAETMKEFQDKVSAGEIRIVIGHSDTLGTGINVQPRLSEVWHLDIPMVPAKREQRDGRAIRFGNMNDEVGIHVMAMQKSLDGSLMSMNLRKATFAEQALMGKLGGEFDDPFSESLMSMADMEAAMNDDPLFYRQRDLEHQIRSLKLDQEAYADQKSWQANRLRSNEESIASATKAIDNDNEIIAKLEKIIANPGDLKVDGKKQRDIKTADATLKEQYAEDSKRISELTRDSKIPALKMYAPPDVGNYTVDAEYGPIEFTLFYGEYPEVVQDEKGNPQTNWKTQSGTIITFERQTLERTRATTYSTLVDSVKQIPQERRSANLKRLAQIEQWKKDNESIKEALSRPYEGQIELDNLQSELDQVNALLFARDNPTLVPAATPDPETPQADDNVAEPEQPYSATGSAIEPETEQERLRREAEQAQQELRQIQAMNEQYNSVIAREWKRITSGSSMGSAPVFSREMIAAVAGRALGSIRAGAKRFEVMIRELRAEHPEGLIVAMKPNLIAVWNSMRPQFRLEDTATDSAFDMVIAETSDAELQKATDAAIAATLPPATTPPAATPDPEIPAAGTTPQDSAPLEPDSEEDPEKTYSLQNASTDFERQKMGLPKRPENSGPKWAAMANVAKGLAETDYGRKQVDTLIADLEARPRATTPIEHFQLLQRYAEVDQKYEDAMEERNAAKRIGDDAQEAISEREMLLFEGQKLQLMNIESGQVSYLLGAGLAARKAEIKRDFTIERMIMEYEAAFGNEPSDEQKEAFRKEIAKYKAGMKALQKLIDERDAKINDLETRLKEAHDAAVDAASSVTPRVSAAKKRAQEKISERWKAISALLGKTYSIETALAQGTKAFIDLAGAYVELGVVSLADYLNRVRKRMGPDAEPLIPQFTEGYNEYMKSVASTAIDDITVKIDPNDDETIGKAVRDLHRMVIQRDGLDASAAGRNAAVVAVHRIIEQIIPGITEEQVARAMSGIGVYAELNKDEIEVIRRDQKAQLLLLEQIRDWNRKQAPPATGVERPPVSDEQRALRKAVNEAKKAAGIVTRTEGQLRSALDAAKRLVRNRISDLNKALEPYGKPIERSKRVSPTDPELDALRAERDDLQKQYDAVFGKNQMSDEQRLAMAEKMMDKAIANLENDLAAGKLYADPKKPPVSSPALEAKREQLDALKASREEMRIQSGESQARSDAAFERHLLERGAELARRIAEKDFAPAPKPEARELTPAMLKQMMANQKMEQEFINQKRDWEFKNRHPIYKAWHNGPVQAMGMIRKGLTTIDQSLIGRQGWLLGITHPLIYGKAIKNAFGSNWVKGKSIFPTEQDVFNVEAQLDADAGWVRLEKVAKLAVTGVHGGLRKTEENLSDVPAWFDKIPGIGGSERAGSAFINSQRRMVFRELVTQLARWQGKNAASLSSADLRVIGNLVNVSTGRASLGKLENAAQVATALFFSPRWWASRLQMMAGVPMWHNSSWFGGEGASKEVRMLVAREWTGQMAAQVAIMTIVVSALKAAFGEPGDDEKWDWFGNPQSPNFGRLRIGSTYIDMTAGLGAHVSMLARMITGKQVNRWETEDVERWNTFTNYVRSKLAPMPGIGADWMKGRSIGGEQFGSPEWVASKTVPLSFQDIRETFKGEGPILGSIVSTMMFFGFSAQTHEARVNARKDLANEVRAMKKQGKSPEVIQKAIDDHLNNAAKLEARQQLRVADPEQKPALEKIIAGEASGELEDAKTKERFDIVTRAAEMLSSESGGLRKSVDDPGIKAARDILKAIAPTEEEAVELYNAAYRRSYGSTMEVVDKRLRPKRNVVAARRRIRALYAP